MAKGYLRAISYGIFGGLVATAIFLYAPRLSSKVQPHGPWEDYQSPKATRETEARWERFPIVQAKKSGPEWKDAPPVKKYVSDPSLSAALNSYNACVVDGTSCSIRSDPEPIDICTDVNCYKRHDAWLHREFDRVVSAYKQCVATIQGCIKDQNSKLFAIMDRESSDESIITALEIQIREEQWKREEQDAKRATNQQRHNKEMEVLAREQLDEVRKAREAAEDNQPPSYNCFSQKEFFGGTSTFCNPN